MTSDREPRTGSPSIASTEGSPHQGVTQAGSYCPDWFERKAFERECQRLGARWGRPLRLHDQANSTQDLAFDAARSGAPSGALFLARKQDAGRGRRGQSWVMQPDDCLTFSLLVRTQEQLNHLEGLSLSVGLALIKSLEPLAQHVELKLKWPNDLYLNEKKLAGILIEAKPLQDERALVIGIGLNTQWLNPPTQLRATSLKAEGLTYPGDPVFLAQLLKQLEEHLSTTLSSGLAPYLQSLRKVDYLEGRDFLLQDFCLRDLSQSSTSDNTVAAKSNEELLVRGAGLAEDGSLLVTLRSDTSEQKLTQPDKAFAVQSGHLILSSD